MENGTSTPARRWTLSWVVLVVAIVAPPAYGQEEASANGFKHVRATDRRAAQLLEAGATRSPAFRTIVDVLDRSDLLVWVETRAIGLPSQMQLLAATPVCRHVRVTVRVPGVENEQIAWLAHELWHAVEVAGAPEVRDQVSLLRFYRRIGEGGRYGDVVESAKAQETWTKVLRELRSAR